VSEVGKTLSLLIAAVTRRLIFNSIS